jgi:cytochrome c6
MEKYVASFAIALFIVLFLSGLQSVPAESASPGEMLFGKYCAACHADGGNVIAPAKTLQRKILELNGIKKPADIVEKMRNPGPGMTRFDEKTISDKEARAIAEYILKTFK